MCTSKSVWGTRLQEIEEVGQARGSNVCRLLNNNLINLIEIENNTMN